MSTRKDPGFVGHPRRIRTQRNEIASHFDHPQVLLQFLGNNVAEHAAFLGLEVVAAGAQLVEHTPGHESGRSELRCGMLEFLAGIGSVILEDAYILEARVALQILDAMRRQQQKLFDFGVACSPQLPVVAEDFPPAPRARPPETCGRKCRRRAATARLRYDTAAWDGPPPAPTTGRHDSRHTGNYLRGSGRVGTEAAKRFGARSAVGHIVTGNDPRTGNRILA